MQEQTYLFTWNDGAGKAVTASLVGDHTLSEVLESFQGFIIASGFCLKGELIVEEAFIPPVPEYEGEPEECAFKNNQWRPISELTEGHKDGRWIIFYTTCKNYKIARCPKDEGPYKNYWITTESTYYESVLAFSYFLELPSLPGDEK